LLSCPPE